jgi:hypothetical protein
MAILGALPHTTDNFELLNEEQLLVKKNQQSVIKSTSPLLLFAAMAV